MQHAGRARRHGGSVLPALETLSFRLDAVDLDVVVAEECIEQAHRVRAAAHARDDGVGEFALLLENLGASLAADD